MLSVIVDARARPDRLAGLLAQLTAAAVAGLVREVRVAADAADRDVEVLCEATGASLQAGLAAAIGGAKGEWLAVLPAELRFADGWVERLQDALAQGVAPMRLAGVRTGGLFAPRPEGALVRRAAASAHPDLDRLRRGLGGARRVG